MHDSKQEQPLFERQSPWRWIWAGMGLIALYQLLLGLWDSQGLDLRIGVLLCIGLVEVTLPILLLRRNAAPIRSTLRLGGLSPAQGLWVVVLAAALVLPVEWLAQWNTQWVEIPEWSRELQDQLRPDTALDWLLAAMALCVFAPIGEELIFRGLMQQALRNTVGGPLAAVVIGLLFALLHFSPWYFLGLATLGVMMGLALERTGSLFAPILLHAAYNSASLAILGYDDLESLELPLAALGLAAAASAGVAYVAYGRLRTTLRWEEQVFSDGMGSDPGPD